MLYVAIVSKRSVVQHAESVKKLLGDSPEEKTKKDEQLVKKLIK